MKGNGKVFFKGMFLLLCIVMVPVSTVFAQLCEGNFDCDQDVDGSDAAVFKQDFGRSPFFEPCDTCIDSPCPCTTTCPNNYEPCVSNDDCDSGCCCNEADADRCHDQTYCESVLGSQCVSLPRDNGEPCTSGIECISGNCPSEDGVCCDTMCSDICEACLASKTGGSDGICGPVIAGTDPDGECGGTGVCDGGGNCVNQNGEPCTNGIECISGNCPSEDGVCCDTMCSDTCEACLASKTGGSDGICDPVIAGTDPDGECGGTEVCDGAGACVSP